MKSTAIETCKCDICAWDCDKNDGLIKVAVNNGDGRGVGSAYITGKLEFDRPYVVTRGIVCRKCKMKYLYRHLGEVQGGMIDKKVEKRTALEIAEALTLENEHSMDSYGYGSEIDQILRHLWKEIAGQNHDIDALRADCSRLRSELDDANEEFR